MTHWATTQAIRLDRDPELAARVHARLEAALDRAVIILRRRRQTFNALAKALFDAQAMDETAVLQILAEAEISMGKTLS